jgi:hypothetical protein
MIEPLIYLIRMINMIHRRDVAGNVSTARHCKPVIANVAKRNVAIDARSESRGELVCFCRARRRKAQPILIQTITFQDNITFKERVLQRGCLQRCKEVVCNAAKSLFAESVTICLNSDWLRLSPSCLAKTNKFVSALTRCVGCHTPLRYVRNDVVRRQFSISS